MKIIHNFEPKKSIEKIPKTEPLVVDGLRWFHWLVISLSVLLTFLAWYFTKYQIDEKVESRFERQVDRTIALVQERMLKYEDALGAGAAAIRMAGGDVDFKTWKKFASSLEIEEKYPGINGIGVIHAVPKAKKGTYLKKQKRLRPNYLIYPEHDQDILLPISYIEPEDINRKAVGLDIAHEANRLAAALQSRDTGKPQISGPITLVQDRDQSSGFLFFVPFYNGGRRFVEPAFRQRHFRGLIYAPFVVQKLMAGTLAHQKRHVALRISDGETPIYDEHQPNMKEYDPQPIHTKKVSLNLYGRSWDFDFRTKKSFRASVHSHQPWVILIGGIIIDLLLLCLFISIGKSNRAAVAYAKNRTADLVENEKLLTDKSERLNLALFASEIGIWDWDIKNNVLHWDDQMFQLFGAEKSSFNSTFEAWIQSLHPKDREPTRKRVQQALAGEKDFDTEFQILTKAPETTKIRGKASVIRDASGEAIRMLGANWDISDESRKEGLLAQTVIGLKKSNEDLDRFAYVASHDLKSPLRAIDHLAQWIDEDVNNTLSVESRENLALLIQRTRRLESLLGSLLTYSRVGRESEDFQEIDVSKMVTEIFEVIDHPKDFKLDLGPNLPVFQAKKTKLNHVFQNLIENAVKHHGRDNGTVRVTSTKIKFGYRFSVADDGDGFSIEHKHRIFELFSTLKSRDTIEGSGVGLALIKKTIENEGGSIWVESAALKKGAHFVFTWPEGETNES